MCERALPQVTPSSACRHHVWWAEDVHLRASLLSLVDSAAQWSVLCALMGSTPLGGAPVPEIRRSGARPEARTKGWQSACAAVDTLQELGEDIAQARVRFVKDAPGWLGDGEALTTHHRARLCTLYGPGTDLASADGVAMAYVAAMQAQPATEERVLEMARRSGAQWVRVSSRLRPSTVRTWILVALPALDDGMEPVHDWLCRTTKQGVLLHDRVTGATWDVPVCL